jgi:hypothetical protein
VFLEIKRQSGVDAEGDVPTDGVSASLQAGDFDLWETDEPSQLQLRKSYSFSRSLYSETALT